MDKEVNEILGNLYKDVKNYDQRINYHADIFIGGCNFEVFINDFPVFKYYGPGNGAITTSIPINSAILNKGQQTWKIKVFPIHNIKEINGKTISNVSPTIQEGARVEIDIEGVRFKESGGIEENFGKVLKFEAPLKKDPQNGSNIFADAGKPYIEYSGTFQADVPYQIEGWNNSEDLTKIDSNTLKQKILKEYQKFHGWLQNRDLNKIALSKLNAKKEEAQALFYDKNINDEYISSFIKMWGQEGLEMQPLENYKMGIYGNGKIVTLIDTIDGGSPLWGNYEVNKNKYKHNTYLLYFHIPKGKTELEVIR
ncbi:hypothetical protein [Chryseobacterium oryctis]|uniref:Uncharacterized protein n=1 Tax=Chryseobacterium oryctis TaxID=2952618 RepID=A0ABT3HN25_9FLAO|nr:hypothetical protein [Chryseobacterium oryctis]MCW3161095.1 hypothetical protein [Chryseobacterium oryctis]